MVGAIASSRRSRLSRNSIEKIHGFDARRQVLAWTCLLDGGGGAIMSGSATGEY